MGFFNDFFRAIMKGLFGESALEKQFRQGMDEAKRLYDFGWQYNKPEDLDEAVDLADELIDTQAAGPMQVFQKYRLLSMVYVKQIDLVVKSYKTGMKRHVEQAKSLENYTLEALEPQRAILQGVIQKTRADVERMRTRPPSRKLDRDIEEKKVNQEKMINEESLLTDHIESLHQLAANISQMSLNLSLRMEVFSKKLIMYFGTAKDLKGLSPEEGVRRDLLLKGNWDELKKIQSGLLVFQKDHSEILGIDLVKLQGEVLSTDVEASATLE